MHKAKPTFARSRNSVRDELSLSEKLNVQALSSFLARNASEKKGEASPLAPAKEQAEQYSAGKEEEQDNFA